jgi:hypothetical protein
MKRTVVQTKVGDNQVRNRTKIESEEPCDIDTHASRIAQDRLLKQIASDPSLIACGYGSFQRLLIHHDGAQWVAEAESVVEVENASQ